MAGESRKYTTERSNEVQRFSGEPATCSANSGIVFMAWMLKQHFPARTGRQFLNPANLEKTQRTKHKEKPWLQMRKQVQKQDN